MDLRMVHQAQSVERGVKFASNLWIHQRDMHPISCYITQEKYEYDGNDDEYNDDKDNEASGDDSLED